MPTVRSKRGAVQPAYLLVLHQKRASLIDWGAKPKVYKDASDDGYDEPDYAIEDYGADYGSEEATNGESDFEDIWSEDQEASLADFFGDVLAGANATEDDEPF